MKYRISAFLYHLLISAFLISTITFGFISYFYPAPFAQLEGVYSVLITLAFVDITLGPILTFILYTPNKKGLFFDMFLVVLLQLSSLTTGLFIMYDQRPGFLVFYYDTFYTQPAKVDQSKISPELLVSFLDQPKVVILKIEGTTDEKFDLISKSLANNTHIQAKTEYYRTITGALKNIKHLKRNTKDELIIPTLAGGKLHKITFDTSKNTITSIETL